MIGCVGNCRICPFYRNHKRPSTVQPTQIVQQLEETADNQFLSDTEQLDIEPVEIFDQLELEPVVTDLAIPEYKVRQTITGKLKGVLQR